ncbi:hypothetical protein [Geomonas azotofigens]|uniref:hypothetical protein n=1 Tax=Geomonas azotofigens TaxID=2843196 RepID=UPI001C1138D5|nr:hypothetical protein [Geomonas azotofigens]MBU5615229.1 hypothetical protein [Geomonas azotofigens]
MKKVVYISWMPLSEKVERDWYISYLQEHGVPVEYWDVTSLLFSEVRFQPSLNRDYLVAVTSYKQLQSLLIGCQGGDANFVMLVNYESRFNRLYRMLSTYGCRLFFFEWGNFPIKARSRTGKYATLLRHPSKFIREVWGKLSTLVGSKLMPVKPFDVVFTAGYASFAMHPRAGKKVPVNLCDFDNYVRTKDVDQRLIPGRYCVFLDINLAYHSDLKLVGWDFVTPSEYVASLERFFGMLEERYHVQVVIAAHPNANYGDLYFGRKAFKGATPELVRDAEFVISHHSTAISYAVLNRKSLLFIYTTEMERIYRDTIVGWMGDFAEYLNQPLYNIDKVQRAETIELREPDPERYDLYKYNYLTTPESEHSFTRDIFLAEMKA